MSDRIKYIEDTLMSIVEAQMIHLDEVDTGELGDVIDMIKDLEEAKYYCSVVKAMEDSEEKNGEHSKYYTRPYDMHGTYEGDWNMGRMYYTDSNGRSSSNGNGNHSSSYSSSPSGHSGSMNGSSSSQYSEREFPNAFQDMREGRSPRSRRMYMEAKETKQDKSVQMKELEKYMQELAQDVVEMVEGSSPEEKQYLSKKISALATKVSQLND